MQYKLCWNKKKQGRGQKREVETMMMCIGSEKVKPGRSTIVEDKTITIRSYSHEFWFSELIKEGSQRRVQGDERV